ncbi:MAG TPA: hypothetical protein DCS87_11610 [Rheinheimera sp.]|nr:hypothetical protein [Rheinheimera sp.]
MKITLSPVAYNRNSIISVTGNTVTVDGQVYDLSALPDNSQCDAEFPATGLIKKVNGVIEVTIVYFYDSALADPIQPTSVDAYKFDISEGVVPSPIIWKPLAQDGGHDA